MVRTKTTARRPRSSPLAESQVRGRWTCDLILEKCRAGQTIDLRPALVAMSFEEHTRLAGLPADELELVKSHTARVGRQIVPDRLCNALLKVLPRLRTDVLLVWRDTIEPHVNFSRILACRPL